MALPVDGQTNWGDPLNAFILGVQTTANTANSSIASHAANSPADPHGDRAYAQGLVTPITSGVNQANGYVKLNSSGTIPSNLISGSGGAGGAFTAIFDAVATYGAVANNGLDQSAKIQNALNACGTAGGGIVWIGPGVFSLANYLVIPNNTWLLLSNGTVLQRIQGTTIPAYIITNVQFGTSNTPAVQVKVSGGTLDAVGTQNLTTNCTPVFLIQANGSVIENTAINNVFNNPAIELNGCNTVVLMDVELSGTGSNVTQATVPAIRLNSSSSSTTPAGLAAGLYNNTSCTNISMTNCADLPSASTHQPYGEFAGSDLFHSPNTHTLVSITSCSTSNASNNGIPVDTTNWVAGTWSISGSHWFDNFPGSAVDTWHSLTLSNGWGGSIRYKMLPTNAVQFEVSITSDNATSFTCATLPAAYRPANTSYLAAGSSGDLAGTVAPYMQFLSSGVVSMNGLHAFSSSATWVAAGSVPLD